MPELDGWRGIFTNSLCFLLYYRHLSADFSLYNTVSHVVSMKDFTIKSEDVPPDNARSTVEGAQPFFPLELPLDFRLRESQEQLEYLVLASLILLYRSSNGSGDATFTWGYYEDSSPVTQVSASLADIVVSADNRVSEVLSNLKALSSRTQNSSGESTKPWADRHMFFAASHSTGQAAPFVSDYFPVLQVLSLSV